MPKILGRFRAMARPQFYISFSPDAPAAVLNYSVKKLYQTQDNLRAVVDFLAASIAQLPVKVYHRNPDNTRERDRTSRAAMLLYRPNAVQTSYEFICGLVTEYKVFGNVYVWLIPSAEMPSGYEMYIVPSDWVQSTEGGNVYAADMIRVSTSQGGTVDIPKEEFIQFKTYSPGNPGGFLSPVSSLRQFLEEQISSGNFRKELWRSSGRLNAQITRPKDVAPWTEEQRQKWVTAFREAWGSGGSKAGQIPLLEDGMKIEPFQTSFKEQQWAESIKLSREAVAAAYRVNPSLIWHTETQTYASAKDNARALYAECLGSDIQMLQQRFNEFLLPKVGAAPGTYVEFDLSEKLKGSFEERASILYQAAGAPYMTRNEVRAELNLPPIEGGNAMIVPMNLSTGDEMSLPVEEEEQVEEEQKDASIHIKSVSETRVKAPSASDEEKEKFAKILQKFFRRQFASILPKLGAGAEWWDEDRWNAELTDDLEPMMQEIADAHGIETAELLKSEYSIDITRNYIRKMAEGRAKATNVKTFEKLFTAIEEDEDPVPIMEKREKNEAPMLAQTMATAAAGWAVSEAVHQAERQPGWDKEVKKVWVTGENPRDSHAAMNGEEADIDEAFSNGAFWPGDDNLSPDESCGCNCSTQIKIRVRDRR